MSLSFVAAWLAVMFPLVFSPGPANVVFAASGAQLGVKRSLPLMAGIDLVFVLKSLLVGFGLGAVMQEYPQCYSIMRTAGACYLFYLGYCFFRPALSRETAQPKVLGFRDGLIIQLLNAKGWIMVVLMFSLFGAQGEDATERALWLAAMLALLNVCTHLAWIAAGAVLVKGLAGGLGQQVQAFLFGGGLIVVGVWLLLG
ncbi:putative threonine efflux protein [Hahella chejuensis KCTC 2396]|uniref:Putative threonine efflux protein n=1 Tax=Hahella chejuensis (strain KCTC 2396) TaxID=349521 RepID=Q2S883_HAHCH|nr:LysE family translocator [Hahella chejuensis]ABC33141.1 putative threonine efflux protein [Hahella chejuensis KCTC 2396]